MVGVKTDNKWLDQIERATGKTLLGGERIAVRDVLWEAYDAGVKSGEQGGYAYREAPAVPPVDSDTVGGTLGGQEDADVTESQEDTVRQLCEWWGQTAHDEIHQLISKMVEYGGLSRATDLTEVGRHLVEAGTQPAHDGSEADLQELGIYFYIVGKMARWSAAIKEGRPVSDDTLLDIGVYVRMAQRIRAAGGWPV